MKTQHTPGPWKVATTYAKAQNGKAQIVTWADQSLPICDVKPLHLEPQESMANADLIAAAPELLEACKFILSQLDPENDHPRNQHILYSDCLHPTDDDKTVVDYLKSAIAKATGQ